jgi:hypothetical protein
MTISPRNWEHLIGLSQLLRVMKVIWSIVVVRLEFRYSDSAEACLNYTTYVRAGSLLLGLNGKSQVLIEGVGAKFNLHENSYKARFVG